MIPPVPSILLGALLLALALYDLLSTTVAVSAGAGPVTARLTRLIWRAGAPLAARSRRVLPALGPVVLFSVLSWWILALIVGWTLIMSADMVGPIGGGSITDLDVVEFAAAAVLGRGTPNLEPLHGAAVLAQQLAGLTGLLAVGLSVAYVLPVVSAVVDSRQFASYVSTLGHTAEEVLARSWDGVEWGELDLHLIALTPMVSLQAERHLAYPMLFSFTSPRRATSLAASMVVLDETVSLLDCADDDERIHDTVLVPLRIAISEFLDTMARAHITPASDAAPLPDSESLRSRDVPLCPQEEFAGIYDQLEQRRRLLHALMERASWQWDDIRGIAPRADTSIARIGLRERTL